jgi:hypothetical protein
MRVNESFGTNHITNLRNAARLGLIVRPGEREIEKSSNSTTRLMRK